MEQLTQHVTEMKKQLAELKITSGGKEQTDGSGRHKPTLIKWVESKIHRPTTSSPPAEQDEGVEEMTSPKGLPKRTSSDNEAPDSDSGFFTDASGMRRGLLKAIFSHGIKR